VDRVSGGPAIGALGDLLEGEIVGEGLGFGVAGGDAQGALVEVDEAP